MTQLLEQLEACRQRLDISPAELRQLAFECVQGTTWPVRSYADLDREQLQKLLDVMRELDRNQVAARMRGEELVAR
jgi:hypothetical protein